MVVFGVVAHLPFIIVQRYNRERLQTILARRDRA
jgi:glycosyl-4,4'-diaponeurosporenoate acyltransferase